MKFSMCIPKTLIACVFLICLAIVEGQYNCVARKVAGRSVLCMCNETDCDSLRRFPPQKEQVVMYTSSESGFRFFTTTDKLQNDTFHCCQISLQLDPNILYQKIQGFGAAATDAAGINWKSLSEPLQKILVDSYFGEQGLKYNMIRVPIGGTDFSTHPYAYNELPENDIGLSNFTLTEEDHKYKIPLIKASKEATNTTIHIVATTWSPPAWMKSNRNLTGLSRLKKEYYQTYADYHVKFLEKYAAENITIWGITTTNEPSDGILPLTKFNSLGWTPSDMGKWIVTNLGPTIRNSTFKNVKILTVDDQRIMIPLWFNLMLRDHPKALDYIDGIAVHYYADFITPGSLITEAIKAHPNKFVLATEACEGSFPWQTEKVELGSWQRALNYARDIIDDFNHNVVGWLDWNMCLNAQGGPNWAKNFVDSPIIVFPEEKAFAKQPMYYAIAHFSRFIPRGSRRIQVKQTKPLFWTSIENVAFLTPYNTIVVVLYNPGAEVNIDIRLGTKRASLQMGSKYLTTLEFLYETTED